MAGAIIGPALPVINEHFNNLTLTSLLLTLPSLSVALMAPFVGLLAERFELKSLLIASLIGYGAAGSSGLWINELPALLIGRFFLGICIAIMMTVCSTLIANFSAGRGRERLLTQQSMGMNVSAIIFFSLGGYLGQLHWRLPFIIYILAILVMVVSIFSLPKAKAKVQKRDRVKLTREEIKGVLPIYILAFIYMCLFYFGPVLFPFVMNQALKAEASSIGYSLALFSTVACLSSMQVSKFCKRFGESKLFVLTLLVFSISHYLISTADQWFIFVVGGCFNGMGYGLGYTVLNRSMALRTNINNRAKLMSGFVSALFLGQFCTPFISDVLAASTIQSVFFITFLFSLTSAFVALIFTCRLKNNTELIPS